MRVQFKENKDTKSDTVLAFVYEGEELKGAGSDLDKKTASFISAHVSKSRKFSGKFGQSLEINALPEAKDSSYERAIIVGLGEKEDLTVGKLLTLGGKTQVAINKTDADKVDVLTRGIKWPKPLSETDAVLALGEGVSLRSYKFDRYKTKHATSSKGADSLTFVCDDAKEKTKAFEIVSKRVKGVNLARDLVTEPPNKLYPESYAQRIKEELEPLGVKVTIFDYKKLQKMGAGGIIAVGQGSARKPCMVVMEYNGVGKKSSKPALGLVGKGITFDTGGYNIKSDGALFGVYDMKFDMGGSAAVVGAMKVLAGRKAKAHVVSAVSLAENSVSSEAFLPSDVIKTLSGQTVEILNTDAEGRLVMSDALWYLQDTYKVDKIMDLATLTGAVIVSLGFEYCGVFSDSQELVDQLYVASEKTGEKVWHMPMDPAWEKGLKSDIADFNNHPKPSGPAASSKAAQFLRRFIQNGVQWAHLDVAGPVWHKSATDLCPKGATGYGVRLLDRFISDFYEEK